MTEGDDQSQLPAEARARKHIDEQLAQAGWVVQDKKDLNLFASQGVAVREVVMKAGHIASRICGKDLAAFLSPG